METKNENTQRKRKPVQRKPTLIRSVKPGQTSALVWEKNTASVSNLWNSTAA